ncbi:MAG: Zn-dependent hydrolase [Hyphomicrobiaceae bacterium]|nr:Zn-dependent hydrolase [Hyphomicrobiaceae bacterium]
MPTIDPDRVMGDLRRMAEFGRYKTGVHRPTYSNDDMAARHWLAGRMADAGLEPEIDGIGNVIGRGQGRGPRVLTGSHTESQNHAGWLDGPLGVIYGLEAARAIGADPAFAGMVVDVGAWADEEGHFGHFMGSRSFCGELAEAEIDAAEDRTRGTRMRDALAEAGLAGRPRAPLDPQRYLAYVEAHIEQGDWLEASGLGVGIVTSIVGIWQFQATFEGVQNHAGTTRMAVRKDAGVALARLCCDIERRFPEVAGERSVWTTGRITLFPGAPSIIPGRAEMLFQIRDADPETLLRLERSLFELAAAADEAGPCRVSVQALRKSTPAVMDARVQAALEGAAERHAPGRHTRMPSGAGHDAQVFAKHMPAGMLFVPSIGGISHHWSEDTSEADILTGAQVFVSAVADLLATAS